MIAFSIRTQGRVNDLIYGFGQGKSYDSSNIQKIEIDILIWSPIQVLTEADVA